MNNVFIGIDPSINSTGLYIIRNNIHKAYIIRPNTKLNKKEKYAQENISDFDYVLYEKIDLKQFNDNNIVHERYKTLNMISIVDTIESTIRKELFRKKINNVYIIQEGISYGSSLRTKSIFDLAGLNYMIRERFIKNPNYLFIIVTPSQVKKFASGNGNCKKDILIELYKSVHINHDCIPKIDDIADAYFMSLFGKYVYENKDKLDII